MTKPFFERFTSYLSDIAAVLAGEAEVASIFPNTTDKGMAREKLYKEFLKHQCPSNCNISLGGFIFDQSGNESQQIDIMITNNKTLQFNWTNRDGQGKSFSCIDGCIAIASVKSYLSSKELVIALENIASLPNKQEMHHNPMVIIKNYDDWPYKIIYATDGVSIETLNKTLDEFYKQNPLIPHSKRPNLIHVLGKYVSFRANNGQKKANTEELLIPNTFYYQIDSKKIAGLCYALIDIQQIAESSSHLIYNYEKLFANLK